MDPVAVVITCYNLGRTLDEAVASVETQHTPPAELLIVDDGSTDQLTLQRLDALAARGLRVLRSKNRGVGAARNRGARSTTSPLLVFLDADDRLSPFYIARLASRLADDPGLAFVTCGMRLFGDVDLEWHPPRLSVVAAVTRGTPHVSSMLRRTAFEAVGGFSESGDAYEDLSFWMTISSHGFRGDTLAEPLFEYRVRPDSRNALASAPGQHDANMAAVYARHRDALQPHLRELLLDKERFLLNQREYRAVVERSAATLREELTQLRAALQAAQTSAGSHDEARLGASRWETRPVSDVWGFDRGLPIDRVYIQRFMERHRADITGHVLEVKDPGYTRMYGAGVTASDVLDIDSANMDATIVADLAAAESIEDGRFDCFILTQTLGLIEDVDAALSHAFRVLKPGGVLLCTLPAAGRLSPEPPAHDGDYWRFTEASVRSLFAKQVPLTAFTIEGYGNVAVVSAFLYGFAAHELSSSTIDEVDPAFPLVYCVRAVKLADAPATSTHRPRTRPPLVLMYHRMTADRSARLSVGPDDFRGHLAELRRADYTVVPLTTLAERNARGSAERLAAITFDDGYVDGLEAADILDADGAAATFFVSTAALDPHWEYWWDALDRMSAHAGDDWHITTRPEQHRRLRLIARDSGAPLYPRSNLTLSRHQVAELAARPHIDIGSHGVSHLALPHQRPEVQRRELFDSRLVLERLIDRPVRLLAYPFGDANAQTRAYARDAGYAFAVTSEDRPCASYDPALAIARLDVSVLDAEAFAQRIDRLCR